MEQQFPLWVLVGPTASGKTRLAVHLADRIGAEILSGDSRQVYRGMDIGTGKDLSEYAVDGRSVPYHLIDIVEPGTQYNLFEYQRDFRAAWEDLQQRSVSGVLCGGSGLYVESVLRSYRLDAVPPNPTLRERLESLSLEALKALLATYKTLHNTTDVDTVKRAVRAIEIEAYYREHTSAQETVPPIPSVVFGLQLDREVRRERISRRLRERLQEGMVEEIQGLLTRGIAPEQLLYYGLEYKYVTLYVTGALSYADAVRQLEIAIHQFAKRQMTWFRGMENRGIHIHWLDALDPVEVNVQRMLETVNPVG